MNRKVAVNKIHLIFKQWWLKQTNNSIFHKEEFKADTSADNVLRKMIYQTTKHSYFLFVLTLNILASTHKQLNISMHKSYLLNVHPPPIPPTFCFITLLTFHLLQQNEDSSGEKYSCIPHSLSKKYAPLSHLCVERTLSCNP